eukprot:4560539-Pleurochrysis_carterae.AAC.1
MVCMCVIASKWGNADLTGEARMRVLKCSFPASEDKQSGWLRAMLDMRQSLRSRLHSIGA